MNNLWTNTAGWAAAALAALSLAFAAPTDSSVMGRLPTVLAKRVDRQEVALPSALPAERTLVLVTFRREQRADAESWIRGLQLRDTRMIQWVRMPVLKDPGHDPQRAAVQERLIGHYAGHPDQHSVMAVLTSDRTAFLRQAGLTSDDRVYALVINRQGEVLARAEGPFDVARADALRETLLGHGDDF